jgi:hypothetical protein
MKPTEIISAEYQKLGKDPSKFLRALNIAINKKMVIIMQENDSVVILRLIGPQKVGMSLASVDGNLKLAKALSKFWKKIQNSKIKFVYGSGEDQKSLSIMKSVGWPIQESDNPKYDWMARI